MRAAVERELRTLSSCRVNNGERNNYIVYSFFPRHVLLAMLEKIH